MEKNEGINFEVNECKSLPSLPPNVAWWNAVSPEFYYNFCCISPMNERLIAYCRETVENNRQDLVVRNLDTDFQYTIDIGHSIIVSEIDWSTKDYLVFINLDCQIVTVKSNGEDLNTLPIEGIFYSAHWNNAGNKIIAVLFYSTEYPGNRVVIMDKDGTNMEIFKFEESMYDGRFASDDSGFIFKDSPNGWGLTHYDLKTNTIDFNPLYGESLGSFSYAVNPKGSSVVICENYGYMYLMDLITNEYTLLRESCRTKTYFSPSFSSDGKSLLVRRRHTQALNSTTLAGESHLYMIDLETDYEERLKLD
ncbi:MAG: hypothetical protein K9H64_17350 [Bacteroidales bacterium]|nr:hypothetical protein [Bacteroidales bacterium]MCF8457726.1 hypothetical protein [Bacteroidales bacterium]